MEDVNQLMLKYENDLRPHFHPDNAIQLEEVLKKDLTTLYIQQILRHIQRLKAEGHDGLIRDIVVNNHNLSVFSLNFDGSPRWVQLPGLPKETKNVY